VLSAVAAFVLAWVLVVYLLIEAEPTYRWVRGFVTERLRPRFDRTAREAAAAAYGYVLGNVTTSVCAAIYFYSWLAVLHVPAALLLALLAFVGDFIPVMGFLLSCLPAMAMAATQSAFTALVLIPIYLAYHVIENYIIGPRVYGDRLRLSNLAVLLAFAVGAELAGVMGALVALPVAAVYPTVERLWLRDTFGDDVVEEHEAISNEPPRRRAS
jgi:predicted PurR-regulated permease PerM